MKYAQIVLLKKSGGFDDELTYSIPDFLATEAKVGSFVDAPFRSFSLKGVITEIKDELPKGVDNEKIRYITGILPDISLLSPHIKIARFISDYYKTSMARALRLFLPKPVWNGNLKPPANTVYKLIKYEGAVKGVNQKKAIEIISERGGEAFGSFIKKSGVSSATISSLVKKGIVEKAEIPLFAKSACVTAGLKKSDKTLTSDQAEALKRIGTSDKPVLLHGITGSGKTEIYLQQILKTIKNGKQAILLVPEIALTPQTINYFKDYIGSVAVFHSKLSEGQRALEWWKVRAGKASLIIGSRSATFAPVTDLGLIILDEEHEWTYKQESAPYYQTHRVAEEMCGMWEAMLMLGSATPKAESYEKAMSGKYVYLQLNERIHEAGLPDIRVVDLRDEFKKKNFSIFSLLLQNKIKERLEKKEQVILFVNQRGMANAVVCRDCGFTEKCPNCDISLKLHRNFTNSKFASSQTLAKDLARRNSEQTRNSDFGFKPQEILICHYCNYSKSPELICPECRSPYIKNIGVGTQRVEEEVRRLFPQARVVRADSDTTRNADGFSAIYHDFLKHKYDILVGTQMVAKGLDFSKVSLIGIVLADIGLHIPDFRSSERLFQILTQVSGRCGRRMDAGEVILQTYNPEHPTIKKIAEYRYEEFMANELKVRLELGYPPFNRMVKFTVVGSDREKLSGHIKTEKEALEDIFNINGLDVKIISAPAMVPKIANRFYYNVLLRCKDPSIVFKHWKPPKGWRIDVDPAHTS